MFQPLGPRVAVLMDEPVSQSGRILIPDKAQKEPAEGTVVAVGMWEDEYPSIDLVVGDRVVCSKYGGVEYRYKGQDYKVYDVYRDILCKLPGKTSDGTN